MTAAEIVALVLMLLGALQTLIAAIGLQRFPDVLTRMHAASKPQTVGLILMMLGVAVALGSVAGVALALLVVLAQMVTVPVSSTMVARAAFRRGFARGGRYVTDELTPRLARSLDEDDDEDGFIDEDALAKVDENFHGDTERFPTNVVAAHDRSDLSRISNWDEEESEPLSRGGEMDIDADDLLDPEDARAAEEEAERAAAEDDLSEDLTGQEVPSGDDDAHEPDPDEMPQR